MMISKISKRGVNPPNPQQRMSYIIRGGIINPLMKLFKQRYKKEECQIIVAIVNMT